MNRLANFLTPVIVIGIFFMMIFAAWHCASGRSRSTNNKKDTSNSSITTTFKKQDDVSVISNDYDLDSISYERDSIPQKNPSSEQKNQQTELVKLNKELDLKLQECLRLERDLHKAESQLQQLRPPAELPLKYTFFSEAEKKYQDAKNLVLDLSIQLEKAEQELKTSLEKRKLFLDSTNSSPAWVEFMGPAGRIIPEQAKKESRSAASKTNDKRPKRTQKIPKPNAGNSVSTFVGSESTTGLKEASISHNIPERMLVDSTYQITAAVSFAKVISKIITPFPIKQEVKIEPVWVTRVVDVKLDGPIADFTIEDHLSTHPQYINDTNSSIVFNFFVTPKRQGMKKLQLIVTAFLDENNLHKNDKVVYDKIFLVDVPPFYHVKKFAAENWQWLWTLLVVPVAIFIWRNYIKKIFKRMFPNAKLDDTENELPY